jgi:hypothetical protein
MDISAVDVSNIIIDVSNIVIDVSNTVLDISAADISLNVVVDKRALNITVSESFNLVSFNVKSITVSPYNAATVDLEIYADNGRIISRSTTLSGTAYDEWGIDDDYIYQYVKDNINTIYETY